MQSVCDAELLYIEIFASTHLSPDGAPQVSVCQRVMEQVWRMRTSCQSLEESFQQYSPTPDLNGEGRGGEGEEEEEEEMVVLYLVIVALSSLCHHSPSIQSPSPR